MKIFVTVLGILLLLGGIGTLGYQSISYTKTEKIAQLGEVTLTATHPKTIYIPPLVSGLCIAAGLILVVVGRKS